MSRTSEETIPRAAAMRFAAASVLPVCVPKKIPVLFMFIDIWVD
jgi:hypothetical protein